MTRPTLKDLTNSLVRYSSSGKVDQTMIDAAYQHMIMLKGIESGETVFVDTKWFPWERSELHIMLTRYEAALEFYGNKKSWESTVDKSGGLTPAPVNEDMGQFARIALINPKNP